MTDEELHSIYIEGAGVYLTNHANEWTIENHQTYNRQMMHSGLRAVYNAGLTRAAEIAETQILIRGSYDRFAAAIDAEKEKN